MNDRKDGASRRPLGLSTSSRGRKRASTATPNILPTKRMSTTAHEDEVDEVNEVEYNPNPNTEGRSRPIHNVFGALSNDFQKEMLSEVSPDASTRAGADSDRSSGESSRFSDLSQEPIWLLHLLALFNCDTVPMMLFVRASKPLKGWNNYGERTEVSLDCLNSIYPGMNDILLDETFPWLRRYTSNLNRKQVLADMVDSGDLAVKGFKLFSLESQLCVLLIVVSAFPEPWCEVTWEAVEGELWEVVESTCLPLLAVIDMDEIDDFVAKNMGDDKGQCMFSILKFLLRLTILCKRRTPQNIITLISRGFDLIDEVRVEELLSPDIEYLHLLNAITNILSTAEENPHESARDLRSLDHSGSMRSNAAIGFALGSLPPRWMASASKSEKKALLNWRPISLTSPSTMEVLAQTQLLGASSLTELPNLTWVALSLETRVLIAFSEAKKKSFANATEVLDQNLQEISVQYGAKSFEILLVVVALINSWNAIGQEVDGERLGRLVWSNLFGPFDICTIAEFKEQTYLLVAMADSFLGQGKYDEAKRILNGVLKSPVTGNDLTMGVTLRLLKMNRRLGDRSSLLDDWTKLKRAVQHFHSLSDNLKYECIEETICISSKLERKDILQLQQVSEVVKILTRFRIDDYRGSAPSRVNLLQNLDELQILKNELNLFFLSGPQLYYCRKMRERFSSATVQLVEKVGSANWQRSKRVKEMREMTHELEAEAASHAEKSIFQDSGLGSSIGSDPMAHLERPRKAKSVTSISSFMSHETDATLLPPIPTETPSGERICFICEKSIKGVKNESQWRRHAFADLRPYICIVEGCNVDHMNFETRTEFANHLREHQQERLWACTHCGHTDESRQLIETHLASTHTGLSSDNAIVEKVLLRDLSKQRCPFCNETPGTIQFVGHLCHHLEEISLTAVPQDVEMDDDDDGQSNRSPTSKFREGEHTQNSPVDRGLDRLASPWSFKQAQNAFNTPNLKDNKDETAKLNLGTLEMDSDLAADIRGELEEEDLRYPPRNGESSLVDAFDLRILRDHSPETSPRIEGLLPAFPARDLTMEFQKRGDNDPYYLGTANAPEENFVIKCICGFSEDDGNTIYCETCDTWQHIECFYPEGVKEASKVDFIHSCADCKPRPLDRQQAEKRARKALFNDPNVLKTNTRQMAMDNQHGLGGMNFNHMPSSIPSQFTNPWTLPTPAQSFGLSYGVSMPLNPDPNPNLGLDGSTMQHPPRNMYMGAQMSTQQQAQQPAANILPFVCDQCPQSFDRNHDLKRHKRIHLAVKPFPCGYCEKSFSRRDALKRHRLVKGCGKNLTNADANRDSQSPVDKSEVMSNLTKNDTDSPSMIKKEL